MRENEIKLILTESEQNLLINGMLDFRNGLTREYMPIEDVNDLILKINDAPPNRQRWSDRDAR